MAESRRTAFRGMCFPAPLKDAISTPRANGLRARFSTVYPACRRAFAPSCFPLSLCVVFAPRRSLLPRFSALLSAFSGSSLCTPSCGQAPPDVYCKRFLLRVQPVLLKVSLQSLGLDRKAAGLL